MNGIKGSGGDRLKLTYYTNKSLLAIAAMLMLLMVTFHKSANAQSKPPKSMNVQTSVATITFDTYKDKYPSFRMERTSSGILTVHC
jgi:hypothetical protein